MSEAETTRLIALGLATRLKAGSFEEEQIKLPVRVPKARVVPRKCLRCDRPYSASHSHKRLCDSCHWTLSQHVALDFQENSC